jgi:hypothetical protein
MFGTAFVVQNRDDNNRLVYWAVSGCGNPLFLALYSTRLRAYFGTKLNDEVKTRNAKTTQKGKRAGWLCF